MSFSQPRKEKRGQVSTIKKNFVRGVGPKERYDFMN
jgi:hypothetical protein